MKKITLFAACLFTGLSFGQNLLTDGSFEDFANSSSAEQGIWSGNGYYSIVTDRTSKGNQALKMDNSGNNSQLKQLVNLAADTKYTISYKLLLDQEDTGSGAKTFRVAIRLNGEKLVLDGNSDPNAIGQLAGKNPDNSGWDVFKNELSTTDYKLVSTEFTTGEAGQYEVFFNYLKEAGTAIIIDDVNLVQGTLSNNDLSKFNFSFAPNPAKNVINLNAAEAITKVAFYNTLGQNTLNANVNALNTNINIASLNKGIYLMHVTIGGQTQAFKVLKQ